ncbi:unnamed protein product, partial [Adineta steineri]
IEYNVTLGFEKVLDPSPVKPYMELMYMSLLSRYSSFIIGSILAFNLINVKNNVMIRYGTIKKYTYLTFIFLFMIILTIPTEPNAVSDVVLTIMVSILQQTFAIAQAFILFSAICPPTHPYYSPWIRSFLSHPIWTPIAKLKEQLKPIHLYQIPFSHFCDKVRWALDFYSLPYESINYSPRRGPALKNAPSNLQKLVPIIEDPNNESTFISDSTPILLYLDNHYGDKKTLFHTNM